ncbi:T9SS type A sorting domain-containing protein [Marivirga tractuosa]|uniref:T9SS type A sorting domain-containing protein n=1 Tax=Marivirga tractuosa TaxID=1006 RepID=UPI0035CF5A4F
MTDPAKTNQTITFAELEARTYGVLGINLNGTSSSGLSLTYESSNPSVATIDGNLIVVNTAGTTTITASQEGDATYNPAEPVSRELVINKADQTITVSAIGDKEVTDEPFDVEASVSSGLQLSYAVEGPATISGNTLTLSEEAGTVTVNVSQAGNVNYNPVSESVSFEVSNPRSDQTISITEISNKFTTDAPFEVEASTTSELALTYEVIGPATIDGTTVTLDGTVGTVEVTASQAGNDNYNPASETISFEVTEDLCLDFSATATTSAVSCAGSTDGTLTVETTEGTAPFSYSLAGADAVENNEFTELEAGEYTVEVTDANGCSTTVTASITSPDALEITAEVENSNSINGNGSISLTVTGGTGEYTYSWSNEATTSSLEALEVGEYTVTVTDESGCTIEESFTIGGVTANEEALAGSLLIFPNPAKNVVQLQHSEKAKSLKLYDARGKLINEIATEGETTELEVSQLPSGLYFIRQEGASQLYRFVKE